MVVRGDASIVVSIVGVPSTKPSSTGSTTGSRPDEVGDELRCHRSKYTVKLVRLRVSGFFDVLRAKLKWGER